jgi:hypothetical protein
MRDRARVFTGFILMLLAASGKDAGRVPLQDQRGGTPDVRDGVRALDAAKRRSAAGVRRQPGRGTERVRATTEHAEDAEVRAVQRQGTDA